jgi:hypothetical protein
VISYSAPTPIPFEDHDAQNLLTSKRASLDVVKPAAARRIGFHVDYNFFTSNAAGQYPPSRDVDLNYFDNRADDNDDHDDDTHHGKAEIEYAQEEDRAHSERDEIRRRDSAERQAIRLAARRGRIERRTQRDAHAGPQRRRRPGARARSLDTQRKQHDSGPTPVRDALRFGQSSPRHYDGPELPTPAHLNESRGVANVATYPDHVKRFATGPLHGLALALYFALLPYVVVTKWDQSAHQGNSSLVRMLLIVLGIFWLTFLLRVARDVVRLRHGHHVGRDGSAWIAGLVVVVLPFLIPSTSSATSHLAGVTASSPYATAHTVPSWSLDAQRTANNHQLATHSGSRRPLAKLPIGGLSLALVAKRKKDSLREHQFTLSDSDIDDTVVLLRSYDPLLILGLRSLIGDQSEGVVTFDKNQSSVCEPTSVTPRVVCVLGEVEDGTRISFAGEGGQLLVSQNWHTDDIVQRVVALQEGGRLVFAHDLTELLRALATRSLNSTLVLYLGNSHDLDEDLRACSITLSPLGSRDLSTENYRLGDTSDSGAASESRQSELRAELLRSDPRIVGLTEPFISTLRRRCVEMTTYLALHRREPVTGDRLRTRVLSSADVDASMRTLANTASAVRRSLGSDDLGSRLHGVTSSGLYVTHALTSDVEIFHGLIARARQLTNEEAAPLLREALALVQGEPLASALRGFEWFLAEGHAARLARDGEWAALALHHDALGNGDYELAFWALEQGRLIDPYSDALVTALSKVPRLREFGGNGTGRAKHESVGAGSAVDVRWSFDRLSDQIA